MVHIVLTLLPILGELLANHVSCLSDWQWAKQEFKNTPLCLDAANPFISFSMWVLKPAPLQVDVYTRCGCQTSSTDRFETSKGKMKVGFYHLARIGSVKLSIDRCCFYTDASSHEDQLLEEPSSLGPEYLSLCLRFFDMTRCFYIWKLLLTCHAS